MDTPVLVDTHAHLDDSKFDRDLHRVLMNAEKAGVGRIVTVGTDIASSEKALEIASRYEGIYAAVGLHPHDAKSFDESVMDRIRELCDDPKVVAIGETGIDFFKYISPRKDQLDVFRLQVELAVEKDLPVIVHCRKGSDECLGVLGDFRGKVRGIAHCFSGNIQSAEGFLDLGFYISFSGTITFANAVRLREIAAGIPDDRLLVETDCPYLAPHPRRGARNEPAHVRAVAETLAELKETDIETIAEITTKNARTALLDR